jgi:phosphoglycolate phosphatase-like HAD superfamily hydrolase
VVKLVLFDIDGTLIRTGGAGVRAFGHAFAMEFRLPGATEHLSFAGRTDTGVVQELFARHHIAPTPENFRRFFDCYVFWLDHLLGESRGHACPGVARFLAELAALESPPRLGLLTGNIRLGAEIKLRHHALWQHFETGAFGDDHHNRNELARIARRRGHRHVARELRDDEILVIGDTPLDIECARAIRARILAVATGGSSPDELRAHRPHWTVPDLTHITAREVCG